MFGRTTKKQLVKALEALSESISMAKKFSSTLDETKRLLDQSQANADSWRRSYEAAQKGADEKVIPEPVVVYEIKPNEWMN